MAVSRWIADSGTGSPGTGVAGLCWLTVRAVPLAEPQAAAASTGTNLISQQARLMTLLTPTTRCWFLRTAKHQLGARL
jgi:hypothetical protein